MKRETVKKYIPIFAMAVGLVSVLVTLFVLIPRAMSGDEHGSTETDCTEGQIFAGVDDQPKRCYTVCSGNESACGWTETCTSIAKAEQIGTVASLDQLMKLCL